MLSWRPMDLEGSCNKLDIMIIAASNLGWLFKGRMHVEIPGTKDINLVLITFRVEIVDPERAMLLPRIPR
jgi:hypothetical protein